MPNRSWNRNQNSVHRGALLLILAAMAVPVGCKAPKTWAYRSLVCLPGSADGTASEYWSRCGSESPNKPSPEPPIEHAPSTGEVPERRDGIVTEGQAFRIQRLTPPGSLETSGSQRTGDADSANNELSSSSHVATSSSHPMHRVARDQPGSDQAVRLASHWSEPAANPDLKSAVIAAGGAGADSKATQIGQSTPRTGKDPLRLPRELPGADAPPLVAPSKYDPDSPEYRDEIKRLYPALPSTTSDPNSNPGPDSGITGLEALHQIARENHPGLRIAAASVEASRGLMIQAGLPPNPKMGYEADTVRTLNTPGYKGAYLQQTIITARKLGLAAEAAAVDYANAVIEQRKTWIKVTTDIRRAYFQVLAARQRLIMANALLELSERAYAAQIQLAAGGEAAPYEPLQLRVLTTQARASSIRAEQESIAAWRMMAAATGVPDLESTALQGHIDCAVPVVSYEDAVDRLSAVHTDLQIAQNTIRKQQTLVTLADRTPIPDLDVGFVLQRDYTFQPGGPTYNLMLGGAIPVFNRNQGQRIAARADLVKASQNVTNTRNGLISNLASVYGVYEANRQLAASFRTDALEDQVRAYRGIYELYMADPSAVSFNDVIVAQQTVAVVLNQYLDILNAQWQSVVNLGELLQVDDLFTMGKLEAVAEIPSLTPESITSE